MHDHYPSSYDQEPVNAGLRRARGIMSARSSEVELRQADPEYDAHVCQVEADQATREAQREADEQAQAELLATLPGSPEQYDDEFGPGTALALARGEVALDELRDKPHFTHATTGDQLNLADVKGRDAAAAEKIDTARRRRLGTVGLDGITAADFEAPEA